MWFRRRRTEGIWSPSRDLVSLANGDCITIGDAMEGIAVLGGTGSGKTSSSGYQISLAMLLNGFGGLVLTAKTNEVDRWRKLCQLAGRSKDLVVFDDSSGHQFNFLDYQLQRQSPESGLTENLVNLIEETTAIVERATSIRSGRGDETYWANARKGVARNNIDLVVLATGGLSVMHLSEALREAPRSRAEAESPDFETENLVGMLLARARASAVSEQARHDLSRVEQYFKVSLASLADKTRSIVESSYEGILDLLTRGRLYSLFSKGTTVTPDDVLAGKIIVVNLPIKRDGVVGLVGQTIWKSAFQQRVEQRASGEDRPCFLFIDEAQNFLSLRDMHFAATARSSKCVNFWLTQNISNVYVAFGGDDTGRAATDSLLGLAQTKIFHQNSDTVTNQWAAELMGRRRIRMRSSSMEHVPERLFALLEEQGRVTSSSSESFEYAVQPHVFAALRKGGMPHRFAEAIVFQGGRKFRATGEPFCRVHFTQGF